ncbi:hypothetical protein [Streptomyces sp. HUAS TT7]|uniref:hypothetical protein n=1 Tax=Streptomyces sp. HUAS TT7 TaxID=3447507 RepID=UPI003F65E8B8
MNTEYFAELGRLLAARGMPEQEVSATVADLTGYLAESGSADAREEFGAPDVFADRLTQGRTAERPEAEAGAETWKWTADIYTDRLLLNQYGAEGWEVEEIDFVGRFVCRRPDAAMRWEYRRETAHGAKGREALLADLEPDGWEPCGRWLHMTYFKRPAAASAGPAAELAATPAQPTRHVFFSAKSRALVAMSVISMVLLVLGYSFGLIDLSRPGVYLGMLGAVPVGVLLAWFGVKRDVAKGIESR